MKHLALLMCAVVAPAVLAVDIGDRAPPLDGVAGWLNGEAVNPAKPDGATRYIIELWATWCGPCRATALHLAKLHREFKDRGVVIVGLTAEGEDKVKPFVESLGVPYRIAMDPNKTTAETWMKGVEGIPHAFIVDTNGLVVWAGHPMDGMREALIDVMSGAFDPEKRKRREALQEQLGAALQAQNVQESLRLVDALLEAEPRRMEMHQLRVGLLAEMGDREAVRAHQRKLLDVFADSAKDLNDLAWAMTAPSPLPIEMRDPEIAIRAALRAAELTDRADPAILDTLAMALHSIGLSDQAVAAEEKAIALTGDAEVRKNLETNLEYFRSTLRARALAAGAAPAPAEPPTSPSLPTAPGEP